MGYQPPTTIAETLRRVQRNELVLPAIQREFVWEPAQVIRLFDSLMRGYPVGSFLSWKVQPETVKLFRFYGFLRDYHELSNRHCPAIDLPPAAVTAVLDGQQRLTSLNIGLRGSYSFRKTGGRRANPLAYPHRRLYLNVRGLAHENEAGLRYDLRFLTADGVAASEAPDDTAFFPVADIFDATSVSDLWSIAGQRGWANDQNVIKMLSGLWESVHSTTSVHFYEEDDQDVERVLDIFIRVNSGGTVLSYSDLLLSIATAQWTERDAREEIHGLVDSLNSVGQGFAFSQDVVLKAGLVLAGIGDFAFRVKNFNATNMAILDKAWDRIAASLQNATGLLADFGLSHATLPADSVLIPVAYYLHQRNLGEDYRTAVRYQSDRALLRSFVLRSSVQPGVWGSGLDTLLRELRGAVDAAGQDGFPLAEIEQRMAARGKPLTLTEALLDDLLDLRYGQKRAFAFLALLFPHVDTRNVHHIDHIFPKALLRKPALRKVGLDDTSIDEIQSRQDLLPNLQLLEGMVNIDKSATAPIAWVSDRYGSGEGADAYLARNAMPALPTDATGFLEFFARRRELLRAQIRRQLELPAPQHPQPPDDSSLSAGAPKPTGIPAGREQPETPAVASSGPVLPASKEVGPVVVAPSRAEAAPTFAITSEGSELAWGRPSDRGLVVQAGSRARPWITRNSGQSYERLQDELVASGVLVAQDGYLVFVRDHMFSSTSSAAAVVLGRSSRGPMEWRISGTAMTHARWTEAK